MPSQSKIINSINYCLDQMPLLDVKLNEAGMCNGLSSLFMFYELQNKREVFFAILDKLSNLPKTYKIGDDPEIDGFIVQMD